MNFVKAIGVSKSIEEAQQEFYYELPVVQSLIEKNLELSGEVTFIIGENGRGKSTLLEALAVQLGINPEGGSQNFNFATVATHSSFSDYLVTHMGLERPGIRYFLRSESYYNLASEVEELKISGYGKKKLHHQSHGEGVMSIVENRLTQKGIYLFDEPESGLSTNRQLAFIVEINRLINQGSRVIIATHSPIILAYPRGIIYELSEEGIQKVTYKESLCYVETKQFLENPERMLFYLLKDDE